MALRTDMYVSCIKIFGVPIVPPLMTDQKRLEMKEYKEKAIAYEHKFKGKRVSLDSGVMITSTDMQKIENFESPTTVLKEPVYSDVNNINKIAILNGMKTDDSISPETPTLISEEDENNFNDNSSSKQSIYIKSETVDLIDKSDDTLIPQQESNNNLTVNNSIVLNKDNLNDSSLYKESSIKSENHNLIQNSCDTLVPKQEPTQILTYDTIHVDVDNISTKHIPRLRSNSYTLSSPSPIMVAFLNSQVQQQLMEPKSLESNINFSKESKSEPLNIYMTNDNEEKILKAKSLSLNSVPKSFHKHELTNNSIKPNLNNKYTENNIISDQNQDERESLTTIGTNFSNDESIVGSVITVFNGNSYDNNSSPNSMTCKSMKHCCCRHSDDEYSISSSNIHYKTPEELNLEAEQLRITKLDLEKRHQEELSNLIRKQREEQEKIAVRYYLVSQSTSGMSFDGSECSESISKQILSSSPSIQSGMTVTNDKSILSDTSSIISSCSVNKSLVCSSPRQRISPRSPHLHQNIKFYHRIRGGLTAKWTRAPTEVENSAATIINAGVRGYLTRRLLRTEKAQMFKKTILDSLKTALIMHMELKKQQPTESDLELHRRIINQLTTACYDLNDLILGSVQERMTVIRGDRERLVAVKMRRKSSSALANNKQSPILKQPKKSRSGYSLSKKASGNFSEKSSFKKY
ncbi:putative uncharacterized protein DDB_G0282499 [Rhopalosiphum maidis]|uniref:putative uncharacterized protein DDB_G0282499 n=1 Tax=Rhopalosiphum maidis TaxID=43146 RepID=UPI000F00102D|nr:putative uncharacterized protein DDB_G0282499 [Rhopalosiphum maidis]